MIAENVLYGDRQAGEAAERFSFGAAGIDLGGLCYGPIGVDTQEGADAVI